MSNIIRTYFKRQLPTSLVAFNSVKGKQLFKSALEQGNAEIYFQLANYYTTQSEPAFCGLGSLSMVLNSLNVDPLKVWKGPWRWYADEMLDCCRSLKDIRENGITLAELSCLAKCNGLTTDLHYATKSNVKEFEKDLISSCSSDDQVMIISYSRKILDQTGDGHFSPIGAYDQNNKMALVMDVARFKYPAYWVSLDLLFESLKPIDVSSNLSRGYIMLKKNLNNTTSITQLNINLETWKYYMEMIKNVQEDNILNQLINIYLDTSKKEINDIGLIHKRIINLQEEEIAIKIHCKQTQLQLEYKTQFDLLLEAIRSTKLFSNIKDSLNIQHINQQYFKELLTLFYLAFPYNKFMDGKYLNSISELLDVDSQPYVLEFNCNNNSCECGDTTNNKLKQILNNEISSIQSQLLNLNRCLNEQ